MTKSLTSDVFSALIFLTVYLTYLPRMPLKAEVALRRLVICDLIAIYCSGEICLYFQIINLTETKWTDWFKPVSSQTPLHWETSSINGHNCFLWRVAGKTYSITFRRERAVTLSTEGWCTNTALPDTGSFVWWNSVLYGETKCMGLIRGLLIEVSTCIKLAEF